MKNVLKLGRRVRTLIRRTMKKSKEHIGDLSDLSGACGYASWALWRCLPGSKLVFGTWDGLTHCWVEYDGYIIDLTASQFFHESFSPVRVIRADGRSALPYDSITRNVHAEREIADWYPRAWRRTLEAQLQQENLI